MLYVVKRDGREVEFNSSKIANAIQKAATEVGVKLRTSQIFDIVQKVINYIEMTGNDRVSVEEVQNLVEKALGDTSLKSVVIAYRNYRKERTKVREIKSDLMKAIGKIGVETDRDNANVGNNFQC